MNEVRKNRKDRAEVKEEVVRAAALFFQQKGIRNVRMDDIANELSISKRTLYELFRDKEELLLEVVRSHSDEMHAYMTQVALQAENVLEVLFKFYERSAKDLQNTHRRFFEDMEKYPKVQRFIEDSRRGNLDEAMDFYRTGVEQGIFRADINYRIVRVMVSEQMNILLHSDACQAYSLTEIFETVVFMHMRGISTVKGQEIVEAFLKQRTSGEG